METSTMEREETAVRDLFARVDEVLDVAHSIESERPQEAARLVHVSHGALSSAEPVRVPIAAKILLVSDKTVRAWAEEGLLTSGFRLALGQAVYTNEKSAFDLGGLGLSRVLSVPSRRHFSGEE
jgi:hypothetical protein